MGLNKMGKGKYVVAFFSCFLFFVKLSLSKLEKKASFLSLSLSTQISPDSLSLSLSLSPAVHDEKAYMLEKGCALSLSLSLKREKEELRGKGRGRCFFSLFLFFLFFLASAVFFGAAVPRSFHGVAR